MPHFSGAQYAIGTPVPISDLQPGDLLFYGPGGSEHVSIYLGGGMMVEAPHTGAVVWNSPVRFGYDFAGARRI
jgi:cell wall-associated NlpC family hydrolase